MATRPSLPSIDFTKLELPKFDMPKIDLPKIELPKIDMPKFDLPKVDMPKVELPKVDTTKVAGVVRDGMYATIGLGVVGAQQATQLAKQLTTKVTELVQRAA